MSFTSGSFPKHMQIFLALLITITVLRVSAAGQGNETTTSTPQLPLATAARPANVPAGYVITPFGYFHSSCVQVLKAGERMLPNHRVQRADGSIEATAASCAYPHFTPTGSSVSPTAPQTAKTTTTAESPEVSGWVENTNVTTGSPSSSYGALVARWTVPPRPRGEDGQVLFFFPGLEDINDQQTSILQPVLGLYGSQWTIASWNCCLSGIVVSSPAVNVEPGDRIYGSMTNTCATGTLSCGTWNVLSLDLSTGQSTILADTPSDGQVFNWAFGGVLEAYYVVSCDDYPPDRTLTFDDVTLFDQNLRLIRDPRWSSGAGAGSGLSPQCGYGVSAEARRVNLRF